MCSNVEISAGVQMPILGFGTWQANPSELENAINEALSVGYRHFDTAFVYENEQVLGKVITEWIEMGKLCRNDVFIVTKLPPVAVNPVLVEEYLTKSLVNLRMDFVDLYLIHTPFSFKLNDNKDLHPFQRNGEIDFDPKTDLVAVWKEMEKHVRNGKIRAIGVSNFNMTQIQKILTVAEIKPAVLQIEVHLYFQQNELVAFCRQNGVAVIAYSPLGSRNLGRFLKDVFGVEKVMPDLLDDSVVKSIAKKYGKSVAQVLLRFTIERGIAVIPKSTNSKRILENFSIFDFELNQDDFELLSRLNQGPVARICDFNFMKGINKHPEYPF